MVISSDTFSSPTGEKMLINVVTGEKILGNLCKFLELETMAGRASKGRTEHAMATRDPTRRAWFGDVAPGGNLAL